MVLSQIWQYPIKSCGGITLDRSLLDQFGLAGDRRWMLVDNAGYMVTQRECPQMTLIQVVHHSAGLLVSAPGLKTLPISTPSQAQSLEVQVWRDRCQAWLADDLAHQWFSEFLQRDVRLVWFASNAKRQVDLDYARPGDQVAFADGFPLLLISQASLDDLNLRLASPIEMQRFRPNLVIEGAEPYAEDRHKAIQIGDVVLPIVKPCARCSIPSIDLHTAKRGVEPTRTLAQYRKQNGEIMFGQNLLAPNHGELEAGMSVRWLK